jgi:hypothetical protein
MGEKGGEIAEVKFPGNCALAVGELNGVVAKKFGDGCLVAAEIAEGRGVFEGELQRFERVVEADDAQRASGGAGGAENGEDVGGSAEADIPQDEFAGMRGEAFGQAELPDVEGLGFRDRADDGMEGFAMGERMDTVDAVGEGDDFIFLICDWRFLIGEGD